MRSIVLGIVIAVCVAPAALASAPIAWSRVRNPILEYPDRAAKDPALVRADGRWWALFSSVDTAGVWRVGIASSSDLRQWNDEPMMPHDPTTGGEASPDVVRDPDGTFVVTYQSFVHDVDGAQAKLYFRTTTDFQTFSPPTALAHELHPGPAARMIDAALVWSPAGLLLGYKTGIPDGPEPQRFELARSTTGSPEGPWAIVGRPDISVFGNTVENYQFLHLGKRWQLLATTNSFDRPYLFDLEGRPRSATGWLEWSKGRELMVPKERWNTGRGSTGITYEHANCAFVIDGHKIGGYIYLVYADSSELTEFAGSGHAKLGLARSKDLVHWSVPPH